MKNQREFGRLTINLITITALSTGTGYSAAAAGGSTTNYGTNTYSHISSTRDTLQTIPDSNRECRRDPGKHTDEYTTCYINGKLPEIDSNDYYILHLASVIHARPLPDRPQACTVQVHALHHTDPAQNVPLLRTKPITPGKGVRLTSIVGGEYSRWTIQLKTKCKGYERFSPRFQITRKKMKGGKACVSTNITNATHGVHIIIDEAKRIKDEALAGKGLTNITCRDRLQKRLQDQGYCGKPTADQITYVYGKTDLGAQIINSCRRYK